MIGRTLVLWLGIFFIGTADLYAQPENDNVLWSALRFRNTINAKWSIQAQPFFRFNQDLGEYQNSSIDLSVRRNLGAKWYVQFLSRTWFLPEGLRDQQFLWFDIGLRSKLSNLGLNMNQNVRWHNALVDDTILSRDFIRYKLAFSPDNNWKFKPTFAIEPWFQLNGVNDFERYRIEPGFTYSFNSGMSFIFIWRRQNHILPKFQQNFWVAVMSWSF